MHSDVQSVPDAPVRIGTDGAYWLAVKKVTENDEIFGYALADADGNIYRSASKKRFQTGTLVRCNVQFRVRDGIRTVSRITISENQKKVKSSSSPKNSGFVPTQYPFREGGPAQVDKTGSYRFTVEMSAPWERGPLCKYVYLLSDCNGKKYHALSNAEYAKGEKLVCRVEVIKEGQNRKYFLTISDDESSLAACLINREIILRKYYKPRVPVPTKAQTSSSKKTAEPQQTKVVAEEKVIVFNRKAAEIFESLKSSGFHKYGKEFTCSCCRKHYLANQGIKSDTRELFLCNDCRKGLKKRERRSNSVYAISTPMGNKR